MRIIDNGVTIYGRCRGLDEVTLSPAITDFSRQQISAAIETLNSADNLSPNTIDQALYISQSALTTSLPELSEAGDRSLKDITQALGHIAANDCFGIGALAIDMNQATLDDNTSASAVRGVEQFSKWYPAGVYIINESSVLETAGQKRRDEILSRVLAQTHPVLLIGAVAPQPDEFSQLTPVVDIVETSKMVSTALATNLPQVAPQIL